MRTALVLSSCDVRAGAAAFSRYFVLLVLVKNCFLVMHLLRDKIRAVALHTPKQIPSLVSGFSTSMSRLVKKFCIQQGLSWVGLGHISVNSF